MKKLLFILALLITYCSMSIAQVPKIISNQGFLTDNGGQPLNQTIPMTFRLFSVSTGGTAVWTESFPSVQVTKGVYNVNLDVSTMTTFCAQYWLEIEVNGQVQTPRTQLTSVPYALCAEGGSAAPTSSFVVPQPVCAPLIQARLYVNVNTIAWCGAVLIPFSITVNSLSLSVFSVATAGTLRIGIYTADGQTKVIDVVTPTISSDGTVTTSVPTTALSPGIYYVAVVSQGTTDLRVWAWDNGGSAVEFPGIASKPNLGGTLSVSPGTLPATFNPVTDLSDIPGNEAAWVAVRLDN